MAHLYDHVNHFCNSGNNDFIKELRTSIIIDSSEQGMSNLSQTRAF